MLNRREKVFSLVLFTVLWWYILCKLVFLIGSSRHRLRFRNNVLLKFFYQNSFYREIYVAEKIYWGTWYIWAGPGPVFQKFCEFRFEWWFWCANFCWDWFYCFKMLFLISAHNVNHRKFDLYLRWKWKKIFSPNTVNNFY